MHDGRKKKSGTSSLPVESVGLASCSSEEGLPIPPSTSVKLFERFLSPDAFRPFGKTDLAFAVVDLFKVSFYPKDRSRYWPWKARTFTSSIEMGLPYDVKVQYATPRLIQWSPPPRMGVSSIAQHLDPSWNAKGLPCLTQTIQMNALRYVRGRYGRDVVPESDNFIVDGSPSDIRREVLEVVVDVITNARHHYVDLLRTLFRVELEAHDIETVVDAIEITIDVPCEHAFHAATRWTDAWNRNLKACSIHRQEARWLQGRWFESEYYKLYPKTFDRLRFEYGPNKDRMTEILGHVMRVSTKEALARDLDALGKEAFARLLEIQSEVDTRDLRLVALNTFIALMEPKTRTAWSKIASALLSCDWFVNTGSDDTCRRLLNRLADLGLVEHTTRGHWRATRTFAHFLRVANTVLAPHGTHSKHFVDEGDVLARSRGRAEREGRS